MATHFMTKVHHCFIEAILMSSGELRREHLVTVFGVSPPTATRIIADFKKAFPNAITLDQVDKVYRPTNGFKPVTLNDRGITPEDFLNAIAVVFTD